MQELTNNEILNSTIIVTKIRKKLASIELLKNIKTVVYDSIKTMNLFFNFNKTKGLKEIFNNCNGLEDYYQFSNKILGSMQIKSEIISFLEFVKLENPKYICEIGVANGGTNFLLSQAIPSSYNVIDIDLYIKNRFLLNYFCHSSKKLNYLTGYSNSQKTLYKVEKILSKNKLDLLFIDGDHSYKGVKQDFLNYKHLVKEGGLIVFHDIVSDYQTKYKIKTNRDTGGVPLFYSRLKHYYCHYDFVENQEQDGYGIGVIRYYSKTKIRDEL